MTICKECKYLERWRSEEAAKKHGQIYECRKSGMRVELNDFCPKAKQKGA